MHFFKFKFTLFRITEMMNGKRENLEDSIQNSKKLIEPQDVSAKTFCPFFSSIIEE